jgi:hypothetical protein
MVSLGVPQRIEGRVQRLRRRRRMGRLICFLVSEIVQASTHDNTKEDSLGSCFATSGCIISITVLSPCFKSRFSA